MNKHSNFMGLVLDDDALHTPDGAMPLGEITRAEFVRDAVVDGERPSTQETSPGAVAGGTIVGGALLGVPGAVGGALLGSTVKEEVPGGPSIKTLSVEIVFETADSAFSMSIPRDQEVAAISFVKDVERAVKHHR